MKTCRMKSKNLSSQPCISTQNAIHEFSIYAVQCRLEAERLLTPARSEAADLLALADHADAERSRIKLVRSIASLPRLQGPVGLHQ